MPRHLGRGDRLVTTGGELARKALGRCGRSYPSEEAAGRSKRVISGTAIGTPCRIPGHGWHLVSVSELTPEARAKRQRRQSRDTIPWRVRRQVHARDGRRCLYCGSPDGIQLHHRRLKQAGGDARPHTDCACNLVSLCHLHHPHWAHVTHRRTAEAEGLIVSAAWPAPGLVPVLIHGDAGGFTAWLTCSGDRVTEAPAVTT
jgi:hypothetical protein